MAGSLPRLPQRLMVRGETLSSSATSRTVSRSGRSSRVGVFFLVLAGMIGSSVIAKFGLMYQKIAKVSMGES